MNFNKNIISYMAISICLLIVLASCMQDNFNGPDAQFVGAVRDIADGSLVEQDALNGSTIGAVELGYSSQSTQFWLFKEDGTFTNNLVFANRYNFSLENGNFFPVYLNDYNIKPGTNQKDFFVTPYIRFKETNIKYDEVNKAIIASFKVEGGQPFVRLKQLQLFVFTDAHVGREITLKPVGGEDRISYARSILPDNTQTYTLSIKMEGNESLFSIHRNYYFRIGALAEVNDVGTIRFNYAPYTKIKL